MHHPFLWFLGGFLLVRLWIGIRLRRAWMGVGRHGHPRFFSHHAWHWHPLFMMRWMRHTERAHGHPFGHWFVHPFGHRFAHRFAPPYGAPFVWTRGNGGTAVAPAPAIDFAALLELNPRQREIFEEVTRRTSLRPAELAEAMSIVGREPFDRRALEFLTGEAELVDELEYLHDSLTAEQRARLRGA
jgi:hypothetical protein